MILYTHTHTHTHTLYNTKIGVCTYIGGVSTWVDIYMVSPVNPMCDYIGLVIKQIAQP